MRRLSVLFFAILLFQIPVSARGRTPQLADTVDLPASFDLDSQIAAKQRAELPGLQAPVSTDVPAQVGEQVFELLVKTQMISSFGLPYHWTFQVHNTQLINAFSLPDGEVEAEGGIARLVGTNRGLWAAVLSHEIAHVARRHAVRKALYQIYLQQQLEYWRARARYGDKAAQWTVVGLQIAGPLAYKKLSRSLEHDADVQGMLLMARAGYHPDYVFAVHHLLRMATGEQSKFWTFFLSDHPRWETRDQRNERAYADALAEYNRLWPVAANSPGGEPPTVAFLANAHGVEDKDHGTGDVVMSLSCRNIHQPAKLLIRFTKDNQPVQSLSENYRNSSGNLEVNEGVNCLDKDDATPISVRIPSSLVRDDSRKLKAEIEVLGPQNELLERSKSFDVHFPKLKEHREEIMARVEVDPPLTAQDRAVMAEGRPTSSAAAMQTTISDGTKTDSSTPVRQQANVGEQSSVLNHAESLADSATTPNTGIEATGNGTGVQSVTSTAPAEVQTEGYLGAESDGAPNTPHDGVTISWVVRDGPAEVSGIREGDVITAIDGVYVTTAAQLAREVRRRAPGTSVTVRYRRGSSISDVVVVLQRQSQITTNGSHAVAVSK